MLGHWRPLHKALGTELEAAPSNRHLRGTIEPAVLHELAFQLTGRDICPSEEAASEQPPLGRGVVVGGAVIDATVRTRQLPTPERSSEALDFSLPPAA